MDSEINGSGIPLEASVQLEYTRATEAFLQRNHEEALRLMEDLASRCENTPQSASAHRLSGGMCMEVAWSTDDPDAKLSRTKNALRHAKRAAGLSPRNIEYAKFYAKLLLNLGNVEEVVEECERALSIENPECPEAIVEDTWSDLRRLIQESNISIISRWMNGEELRGRRALVDPIELRLVQSDGAETRVAAYRQAQNSANETTDLTVASQPRNTAEVQQKEMKEQEVTDASQPGDAAEEQQKETKEQDVTEATQTRDTAEEQQKETKEQDVTEDVTEASQPGDVAEEQQKETKEQDVTEGSQPGDVAEEQQKEAKEQEVTEASQPGDVAEEQQKEIKEQVVPEASQPRSKAKKSKKSKEQSMPQASQQGSPVKSQSKSGKGTRAVSPEVPDWVLSYWDSLSSEVKKDLLTIKVSDLKKHLSPSKDRTLREVLEEAIFFEECFKNSWKFWSCCGCSKKLGTSDLLIDHAREEHWESGAPKTEKRLIPESVDDEWLDYLRYSSWEPVDMDAATKMIEEMSISDGSSPRKRKPGDDNSLYDWPLSNDPERKEILLKIYTLFEKFDNQRQLTSDLVRKVTEYAVAELKGLACGTAAEQEVNQTPVCIRFLGAPELKRIKKFLEDVSKAAPLNASHKSYLDDPNCAVDDTYVIEKIRLEEDGSLLVIDEQSLPCNIDDVPTAPNASHVVFDNGVILDSDALLSWIYTGASSPLSARLEYWKRALLLPTTGHQKAFNLLKTESGFILTFCERKRELFGYEEALMVLEQVCLEEGKKKDGQDYEKLLEERCEKQNINSAEHYVTTRVLARAKSIKSGEISFEEAYDGGITFHPQDWRKKEHRHEADSYVEAAIQKLKDALVAELRQGDITMMGVVASMKRIQYKMAENSCNDFRAILIPFIRSFLKAQLEDVAMIEATKKANAMAEELISEESKKPEKKKGKNKDQKKKK